MNTLQRSRAHHRGDLPLPPTVCFQTPPSRCPEPWSAVPTGRWKHLPHPLLNTLQQNCLHAASQTTSSHFPDRQTELQSVTQLCPNVTTGKVISLMPQKQQVQGTPLPKSARWLLNNNTDLPSVCSQQHAHPPGLLTYCPIPD